MIQVRVDADQPVRIDDLGVTVGPGSIWISPEEHKGSMCLQALLRLGKVRVSSSQRCRVSQDPPKKKPPHTVSLSRPSKVPRGILTHHTTTEILKEGIPPQQAAEMINKAASDAAAQAVAAMAEQFKAMMERSRGPSDAKEGIEQVVEQAVLQALKTAQTNILPGRVTAPLAKGGSDIVVNGPEDPLFIPTGIVRADTKSLSVQSDSTSDGGGLDDAATALKALRKQTKA